MVACARSKFRGRRIVRLATGILLAQLLLAAFAANADEVQFTNGDKLTGTVIALADGKLDFDSKVAGKLSIPWAEVATFSSEKPVTIVLADDSVIVDQVLLAEPGSVRTAGSQSITPQTVTLANAVKLNPEPEQWKGALVAGAAFDRGNTVRSSGTGSLDAVRRGEDDRITFGAGYAAEQTEDNDTGETSTTRRQMFMALQYDLFFTPKWYMYANARGEKDGVADIALRFTSGVGLGYQFVDTADLKFNIEAGPTWVSVNYDDDTENQDYLAARVAWNLDWMFYSGVSFFHNGRAYPSLESRHDQLVETRTGLRYKLFGDFFGESRVHWTWDSSPAEDAKRQDLSVILGLGYGF
jgi:putative salt-induced outer membrane protein YdiY